MWHLLLNVKACAWKKTYFFVVPGLRTTFSVLEECVIAFRHQLFAIYNTVRRSLPGFTAHGLNNSLYGKVKQRPMKRSTSVWTLITCLISYLQHNRSLVGLGSSAQLINLIVFNSLEAYGIVFYCNIYTSMFTKGWQRACKPLRSQEMRNSHSYGKLEERHQLKHRSHFILIIRVKGLYL